jgi:hypothetical protein
MLRIPHCLDNWIRVNCETLTTCSSSYLTGSTFRLQRQIYLYFSPWKNEVSCRKTLYFFHNLCSVHYDIVGASSTVNDTDCYVIIVTLLDSIFNRIPVLIRHWETQICLPRISFGKTAYMTAPLWSSGQSSRLQIQRFGFHFNRNEYQKHKNNNVSGE